MGVEKKFARLKVENATGDVSITHINKLIVPDDWLTITGPDQATLVQGDIDSLTSLTNITVDADTDANGSGTIALRTRNLARLTIENDGDAQFTGSVGIGGTPAAMLDLFVSANNSNVMRISPDNGATYGYWHKAVFKGSTPQGGGDTRPNWVFSEGFNLASSGRVNTGEAALGWVLESHWNPGASDRWFEHYIQYYANVTAGGVSAGASLRPFSFVIDKEANAFLESHVGNEIYFLSVSNVQNAIFQMSTTAFSIFLGGSTVTPLILFEKNDAIVLQQRDSTGNSRNLIHLNSFDRWVIGDSALTGANVGIQLANNVSINDNDGPVSTIRLLIKTASDSQVGIDIRPFSATQTGHLFATRGSDGSLLTLLTAAGELAAGSGSGGAAIDVGLKRLSAGVWKVTDAASGFGSMSMNNLTAAGVLVAGSGPTTLTDAAGKILSAAIDDFGTSFPGSPATGSRYFRTDRGIEYYYDGTRWLSVELFTDAIPEVSNIAFPYAATALGAERLLVPYAGTYDLWLVEVQVAFFVLGGTALSASHKWVSVFQKLVAAGTATTIATVNIDSGASSVWRTNVTAIGALLSTTHFTFSVDHTKTGTPGNLYTVPRIVYRLVG